MEEQLITKTEENIKQILNEGINQNNLEMLYKLAKIKHMAKEDSIMYREYGNYGARTPGYNTYGRYDNYGARGYDMKYRGYDHLDRLSGEYNRYNESRERYGNNEDTKKSLKYMLESMEDFARMLREDAQSQEEVQMIRETAQRIAQM